MSLLLPHPGKILKPYFEQKKAHRPNYSLRALARDLEMSPAFVSQIFSCQRSLSLAAAENFVRVLKVQRSDATVLRKSVVLYSKENKDLGKILNEYLSRDPLIGSFRKYQRKNFQSLQFLTNWHQLALMELLTCEGYQTDEPLMARKLKISLSELRSSLSILVKAGLIEKINNRWIKKTKHQDFATDTSHEAVRQYHRTMTNKAIDLLSDPGSTQKEEVRRRRMTGATLAVNPEKLNKALEEIDKFLFKMTSLLGDGDCSDVYQINLQLFPLTKENP